MFPRQTKRTDRGLGVGESPIVKVVRLGVDGEQGVVSLEAFRGRNGSYGGIDKGLQ